MFSKTVQGIKSDTQHNGWWNIFHKKNPPVTADSVLMNNVLESFYLVLSSFYNVRTLDIHSIDLLFQAQKKPACDSRLYLQLFIDTEGLFHKGEQTLLNFQT